MQARTEVVNRHRVCPRCVRGGAHLHDRDGEGRQRFRCRGNREDGCGRSFNALTGTPLSRLRHTDQWGAYARFLCEDFRSVKCFAIHPELTVSASTIFRWRHRFLRGLSWVGLRLLDGIVEADATFLRRSFKGHRGWRHDDPPIDRKPRYRGGPIRHRGLGRFHMPVVTVADRKAGGIPRGIGASERRDSCLVTSHPPPSLLITDGYRSYRRVIMEAASEHLCLRQRRRDDPDHLAVRRDPSVALGLGRVNAHHERIKTFVNRRARGVSTRYLENYLTWLRMDRRSWDSPTEILRAMPCRVNHLERAPNSNA